MIIEAIHKRSGTRPSTVLVKLVAVLITIAAGGLGRQEEPGAQLGTGISSLFTDLFKFDKDHDRRKLIICGVSTGFASKLHTISGCHLGVEVLFIGNLLYDVLLPALAGIVSYQMSSAPGIAYFHAPLQFVPVFSAFFLAKVILAGIFFGVVSLLLIEFHNLIRKASEHLYIWVLLKGVTGGEVLVL